MSNIIDATQRVFDETIGGDAHTWLRDHGEGAGLMNYSVLPPEINSLRMFTGAGSAPMLAASVAWDGLAAELAVAASSFGSVTSGLAGQSWQGAAAAAMAAAAAPYAGWLAAAAARAAGASAQAKAVASAFEAARAATVHPMLVAANRNAFVQLVLSNLFGQNAPAIAAAEAMYEQMWAADVAAMVGYHGGASAAAAHVGATAMSNIIDATQRVFDETIGGDAHTWLRDHSVSLDAPARPRPVTAEDMTSMTANSPAGSPFGAAPSAPSHSTTTSGPPTAPTPTSPFGTAPMVLSSSSTSSGPPTAPTPTSPFGTAPMPPGPPPPGTVSPPLPPSAPAVGVGGPSVPAAGMPPAAAAATCGSNRDVQHYRRDATSVRRDHRW